MYNRLFSKILNSSIWLEPDPTRLVWITLLAAMDRDGFAHFSALGNLAHAARVHPDEAAKAIETLENPDAQSENPNNEGRRIERVPGGWIVLNAAEYATIANSEHTRALGRERASAYRKRHGKVTPVTTPSRGSNETVTPSESESESDTIRSRARAPVDKSPARAMNGSESEAVKAWVLLLASDGSMRPPKVQAALDTIPGGWPSIRMRTPHTEPMLRASFLLAYDAQP